MGKEVRWKVVKDGVNGKKEDGNDGGNGSGKKMGRMVEMLAGRKMRRMVETEVARKRGSKVGI